MFMYFGSNCSYPKGLPSDRSEQRSLKRKQLYFSGLANTGQTIDMAVHLPYIHTFIT